MTERETYEMYENIDRDDVHSSDKPKNSLLEGTFCIQIFKWSPLKFIPNQTLHYVVEPDIESIGIRNSKWLMITSVLLLWPDPIRTGVWGEPLVT